MIDGPPDDMQDAAGIVAVDRERHRAGSDDGHIVAAGEFVVGQCNGAHDTGREDDRVRAGVVVRGGERITQGRATGAVARCYGAITIRLDDERTDNGCRRRGWRVCWRWCRGVVGVTVGVGVRVGVGVGGIGT